MSSIDLYVEKNSHTFLIDIQPLFVSNVIKFLISLLVKKKITSKYSNKIRALIVSTFFEF